MRLRIDEQNSFYPDLMVACDENTETHAENSPSLIVEVLSPSTSWVDNGRKRLVYLELNTLRHYLVVDIENQLIEHFHRPDGSSLWTREVITSTGAVVLTCPSGRIQAADIFKPDPRITPTHQ